MRNIFAIFILLLLFFTSSSALGYDGNYWQKHYGKKDDAHSVEYAMLLGYVQGYIHGKRDTAGFVRSMISNDHLKLSKTERGYTFNIFVLDTYSYTCRKDGITNGQIFAIVDNYIKKNPQDWHKNLTTLIDKALRETDLYDCSPSDYGDDHPNMLQYIKQSF